MEEAMETKAYVNSGYIEALETLIDVLRDELDRARKHTAKNDDEWFLVNWDLIIQLSDALSLSRFIYHLNGDSRRVQLPPCPSETD
jgi:hypothetical protein